MTDTCNKPPLIAHIIYALSIGGLENGLVNIINRMPAKQYRHAIICLSGHDDFANRIERDDVELFDLNKRPGKDIDLYRRCFKRLSKLKPDIVHTRNLTAIEMQLPAFFAGISARIHSEHGWSGDDPCGLNKKNQFIRKAIKPFVKHYIPLSSELESYLHHTIGVNSKQITRICNGVDTQKFKPTKKNRALYPEAYRSNELLIIGAVGRMDIVKDPLTLIRAFSLLLQQKTELRNNIRLIWIGDGSQYKPAKELIAELQLNDICWLPGARDDVAELIQGFDLYVLPSLAEGISNTLMEAMATGLPVVATNVGGNAELITDGMTGQLVNKADPKGMADSISAYIESSDLRQQHGTAGRDRAVEMFSLDTMVKKYTDTYDKVIVS